MKEGYQVVAVAPKDNFTSKLVAEGISYREIRVSNYGTNPMKEVSLIRQLYKIYKEENPALIFHYTIKPNIYGSIAASLSKHPSIIVTTGLGHLFKFSNFLIRWTTLTLYRIASFLSKELWFLNDFDRDVFIYKRIVRKKKTKILKGEGINTEWFKIKKERKYHLPIRFLFAGRLLWDKGLKQFVDAAIIIKKRYPHVKFEILGFIDQSNPNSVPYETILKWQKQRIIKYLGESTDVRPFIEKTHCLIFPSYYREGISRILMEAASMETPIITSDNVGCRDVVEHNKTGFICEPQNVKSLVSSIEKFLDMSPQDKLVMGKLARKKMKAEFDQKYIFKAYLDTIQNFAKSNVKSTVK